MISNLKLHLRDNYVTENCCCSGIELAKSPQTDYPEIKVVILTGYDHFEYEQEAIEHNIFSYLFRLYKSIKLTEVFNNLKIFWIKETG